MTDENKEAKSEINISLDSLLSEPNGKRFFDNIKRIAKNDPSILNFLHDPIREAIEEVIKKDSTPVSEAARVVALLKQYRESVNHMNLNDGSIIKVLERGPYWIMKETLLNDFVNCRVKNAGVDKATAEAEWSEVTTLLGREGYYIADDLFVKCWSQGN